jgi:predicted secreted acid phosphatase
VTQYHQSDSTKTIWLRAYAQAKFHRRPRADYNRPAVVLDIDETALSNWEVVKANDFSGFTTSDCPLPDPRPWRA